MEPPAGSRLVTPTFAALVVATLGVFVSFGVLVVALPLYARDALGTSDLGVGIAVGAGSIGAVVAAPAGGRIADRRGRRLVLFVALALMLAAYLALALRPPLAAVVPVRIVAGLGEGGFIAAAFTMAADLAPSDRRGEAMSLITVGAYGGLAVGPIAADAVLGGDRFALAWLTAAASVALAGAAALAVRETRPETDVAAPHGWLPPRPALLPGAVLLFGLLGFGGFNAFAALHARDVGLENEGAVFAVFGGVVVAVRIVGRRLPDRLGARSAASLATAAIVTGLVAMAAWTTEAGLLLGTTVFAAGQALLYPAVVLLAMARTGPGQRSAAVGAVAAFVDVALASGAFILGIAAHASGYPAVFLAGALSAALALALLVRTTASRVPPPAAAG